MNVKDYLPAAEKKEPNLAVQGYVPCKLRKEVCDQMKKDKEQGIKITWDSLLEGLLRSYVAERKSKRGA